ncbi:nSTAND3 domain-containing NTPase [Ulvibacter antarcticus]|uniref:Restriction endonuclease n=1 Tax=Ulvibacter antarcticus TaxID=442714 RepID=A0A3L9ZCE1_9FLAO|nr:hypothetical protein [Ulvibacter antarcticus]RMA64302.1 restriction endonuclease [Ulvibacter antarcticus]
MTDYSFSSLNSTDLEKLACDLLTAQDKSGLKKYRTFKEGKDQGIDCLYSNDENPFSEVVQVKHYLNSGISKLLSDLRIKEKPKVDKLNPDRYILVTSLQLSVANVLEIKKIFNPYIKNISDIYGRDDLNRLLAENKEVESRHQKLWFSSSNVLDNLLKYKYQSRTDEFYREVILRNLRLYVETNNLEISKRILLKKKILIITGEPGVGKTTLSEILLYYFTSNNYELNIIQNDIREVENVIKDDSSKQIFYFDDFLGSTQVEIQRARSADSVLIKLINRIKRSENKLLILNTRKFILTSAIDESENLGRLNLLDAEAKIELSDYSIEEKLQILNNHIVESNIKDEHIKILKDDDIQICEHPNFTPRIIEFFTTRDRINSFNKKQLKLFIKNNLDNPIEIWRHAYLKQIGDEERFLLNTLLSIGRESSLIELEKAFESRYQYEITHNNFIRKIDVFNQILKKLNDGFIKINLKNDFLDFDGFNENVTFINPSLQDFLEFFIIDNDREIERITNSSVSIRQLTYFYPLFKKNKYQPSPLLKDRILNEYKNYIYSKTHNKDKLNLCYFIFNNLKTEKAYLLIAKLIKEISEWSVLHTYQSYLFSHSNNFDIYILKFLQETKYIKPIYDSFKSTGNEMFKIILLNLIDIYTYFDVKKLMEYYELSYDSILVNTEFREMFELRLDESFDRLVEEEIFELERSFANSSTANAKHNDLNLLKIKIKQEILGSFSFDISKITEIDWDQVSLENKLKGVEPDWDEIADNY